MIWNTKDTDLGPGEARTRQRVRTQVKYLGLAGLIGGTVGFLSGVFDKSDNSLFAGSTEAMQLPPALAVVVALLLLGGFLALPLYGFRLIDDYKREHNYIGFTGGCLAVLAGYPVWAVLHAGGFVPPPHAFGVFAIAFGSMIASYLYARWRL